MPSSRALLASLIAGSALFVLFAFTLVGLIGEAIVALALIGLLLRGVCAVAARARGTHPC